MTAFVGKEEVGIARAIIIKHACKMWATHKMQANRAYTPTAMLTAASGITGKVYKRGQHAVAAADLDVWLTEQRAARDEAERNKT